MGQHPSLKFGRLNQLLLTTFATSMIDVFPTSSQSPFQGWWTAELYESGRVQLG